MSHVYSAYTMLRIVLKHIAKLFTAKNCKHFLSRKKRLQKRRKKVFSHDFRIRGAIRV